MPCPYQRICIIIVLDPGQATFAVLGIAEFSYRQLTKHTLSILCQFVNLKVKFIYTTLIIHLFYYKITFIVICLGNLN
jgi:hypothetical protein